MRSLMLVYHESCDVRKVSEAVVGLGHSAALVAEVGRRLSRLGAASECRGRSPALRRRLLPANSARASPTNSLP